MFEMDIENQSLKVLYKELQKMTHLSKVIYSGRMSWIISSDEILTSFCR